MAEPQPSPLGSRKSAAIGLRLAGFCVLAALILVACGSDGGSQDVSTASDSEASDSEASDNDTSDETGVDNTDAEADNTTGSSSDSDASTSDTSDDQSASTDSQESTTTTANTAAEAGSSEDQITTTAATDQIDKTTALVDQDKSKPTITPSTIASDTSDELSQKVIGMSEADAIELVRSTGRGVRVEMRDGEEFMLTQDFAPDRLNLTVVADKVTAVRLG